MVDAMISFGRLECLPTIEDETALTLEDMSTYLSEWQHSLHEWKATLDDMEHRTAVRHLGPAADDKMLRSFETNMVVMKGLTRSKLSVAENLASFGYVEVCRNQNVKLVYRGLSLKEHPTIELVTHEGESRDLDVPNMECDLFNHLYVKFKTQNAERYQKKKLTEFMNKRKRLDV